MDWNDFYINLCREISKKSKDRSTKVGCVIVADDNSVLSIGFNGFPRGVNDDHDERHERPTKYFYVEHSERNAIYNAARNGIRLEGSTLFLAYDPIPCADCARGVIQSGIKEIVGTNIPFSGKGEQWKRSMFHSLVMMEEAGIKRKIVEVSDSFLREVQGI